MTENAAEPVPRSWTFVGYRPDAHALGKHSPATLNPPDVAQYQGVVFADGSAAMRWMTEHRSTSVWDSFESLYRVHGHPEYGTQIVWDDEPAPGVAEVVAQVTAETFERMRAESERLDQ